jgi:hypothetical protein
LCQPAAHIVVVILKVLQPPLVRSSTSFPAHAIYITCVIALITRALDQIPKAPNESQRRSGGHLGQTTRCTPTPPALLGSSAVLLKTPPCGQHSSTSKVPVSICIGGILGDHDLVIVSQHRVPAPFGLSQRCETLSSLISHFQALAGSACTFQCPRPSSLLCQHPGNARRIRYTLSSHSRGRRTF